MKKKNYSKSAKRAGVGAIRPGKIVWRFGADIF